MDLHYRVQGTGEPLIILHGLFGSSGNWSSIARRLADRHRVYCVDLRNHGNSAWDPDMHYTEMATDVLEFLNARELREVTLMGHSMGGKVAMLFALLHPQYCRQLIVLDMAPVVYPSRFQELIHALRQLSLARLRDRVEADEQLRSSIPEPRLRAFLLQNLVREQGKWRWRLNLPVLFSSLEEIHGFPKLPEDVAYHAPAMFLHGGASDYLRAQHHLAIQLLFPQAQITTLPGAGHWLHAESPDVLSTHVLDFLSTAGVVQQA